MFQEAEAPVSLGLYDFVTLTEIRCHGLLYLIVIIRETDGAVFMAQQLQQAAHPVVCHAVVCKKRLMKND